MSTVSSSHPNAWWQYGAPLVFVLFWSAGFAVGKVGLEYAQPLFLLSLRYVCIVIALLTESTDVHWAWPFLGDRKSVV